MPQKPVKSIRKISGSPEELSNGGWQERILKRIVKIELVNIQNLIFTFHFFFPSPIPTISQEEYFHLFFLYAEDMSV